MVAVWLYSTDGHALYYVAVPLPMPFQVFYAGLLWTWDGSRYVETAVAQAVVADPGLHPPALSLHYPTRTA